MYLSQGRGKIMKGSENAAYEADRPSEEGDIPLGNVNVQLEPVSSTKDEEDAPEENLNFCSRIVVRARSAIHHFVCNHKKAISYLCYAGLNIFLVSYLAEAVLVYKRKGHKIGFWNGLGTLGSLYLIGYGSLLYYKVWKPCIGSEIPKRCCNSLQGIFLQFWKKRYVRWICYLIVLGAVATFLIFDIIENVRRLTSLMGIVVFFVFGFIFSSHPGRIKWRPVFAGLALQFTFGLLTIKWQIGRQILSFLGDKVSTFLQFTQNGTTFVYGSLVEEDFVQKFGPVFAFSVLPVIFFFSFFVNMLSYYGILQWFIMKIAWVVQLAAGTTVCESVNAAASIFLGMTESMLLFKHHIKDLTKSELHAIMCEGWATVAGTVLVAYISFGINPTHLISASVMSAPGALSYSKLFYPETEKSKNTINNITLVKEEANNLLDAACKGAITALEIVSSIIANIVAFLAFVAFLDSAINWCGILIDLPYLSFEYILTKIFVPISFLMGVDHESLEDVALLVGTKTVVNEFRAYMLMSEMKKKFSARTEAIATYALCGFSNFSSIGILVGALSSIAPSQRLNATSVAFRAFIASNIACFITACVAGVLIDV